MLVTLLEIETLGRLWHWENALDPMLVTLLGIVTLVRPVQLANAESPIAGDRQAGDHGGNGHMHRPGRCIP